MKMQNIKENIVEELLFWDVSFKQFTNLLLFDIFYTLKGIFTLSIRRLHLGLRILN